MSTFLPKNCFYRHLLFWLVVVLYFFIPQWIYPDYIDTITHYFFSFNYQHSPYFIPILFTYILGVGMLYAYAVLRWAMPSLLNGRYGTGIGLYLLTTVVICYLFRTLKGLHIAVLDPLIQSKPLRPFDSRHFDGYFFNQVYIHEYSTIILVLAIYTFFTHWLQKQQQANQLEREKISTEIQLLKTQVNPDFVFNSLDELEKQTRLKSEQASALVLDLAHFLRYVLYENKAETVPLALEMDIIQHYVSLQRVMHPTDLEVSLTVRGDPANLTIPPYVLFPVVENAFGRLGLDQITRLANEPAWVSIDLAVGHTHLTLKVINGQPDSRTAANNSMDMATIQKQLYFHYADAYELQILSETDAFIVALTVPLVVTPMLVVPQSTAAYEPPMPDRR